jgi:L-alanine-DL-glutamate epimerase-like enolase superfamily enzyme
MYLDRAQIKDSYVSMNEKPGWGVELDWKFINSHLAA